MKIVVFGPDRRVGAQWDGQVVDLNAAFVRQRRDRGRAVTADEAAALVPADLRRFIAAGHPALERAAEALEHVRGRDPEGIVHRSDAVRLHAPWAPYARIACAGGNYAEHLAGAQAALTGRSSNVEEVRRESRAAGPWGFFKVLDHVLGPG